jgi:hypothetical protein
MFGFVASALDYGGLAFEDDKPDTLAEALGQSRLASDTLVRSSLSLPHFGLAHSVTWLALLSGQR